MFTEHSLYPTTLNGVSSKEELGVTASVVDTNSIRVKGARNKGTRGSDTVYFKTPWFIPLIFKPQPRLCLPDCYLRLSQVLQRIYTARATRTCLLQ